MVFTPAGKKDVSWELILNTELETGFLDEPSIHPSGEELIVAARSMCVLRLVKGSQEDARNTSWKHHQKSEPAEPPRPPAPDRTFRDATTSGPKRRYDPRTSGKNFVPNPRHCGRSTKGDHKPEIPADPTLRRNLGNHPIEMTTSDDAPNLVAVAQLKAKGPRAPTGHAPALSPGSRPK